MKKNHFIYSLTFLFLLNILLIISIHKNKHDFELPLRELLTIIDNKQENYNDLRKRMFSAHNFEGYEICLDPDLNIEKFSLILRYPQLSCTTCMDSLFYLLSTNFSKEEIMKVAVVVNHSHQQYLNQIKRLYKNSVPNITQIDEKSMVLPIDTLGIPYFFVVNENKCMNIFLTDKDKSEETKEYINLIQKKYFINSTLTN